MSEKITTAEELDALPVGSVVHGDDGRPWVRECRAFTSIPTWHTVRSHGDYEADAAGLLPAVLLYRPDEAWPDVYAVLRQTRIERDEAQAARQPAPTVSAEPWQHDGHRPVQHRDGKPPWCNACGYDSPTAARPAARRGEPRG